MDEHTKNDLKEMFFPKKEVDPNKDINEIKKSVSFIVQFVVIVGIFLVLNNTIPSYDLHKIKVTKFMVEREEVGKKLVGNNKGDEGLRNLIDKGSGKLFGLDLWGRDFKVNEHLIFSVGSISYKGKRGIISIGIIGKVFVLENIWIID